jgi:hypothetical protein
MALGPALSLWELDKTEIQSRVAATTCVFPKVKTGARRRISQIGKQSDFRLQYPTFRILAYLKTLSNWLKKMGNYLSPEMESQLQ